MKTGVIMWGPSQSWKEEATWSPVGSWSRPSASPCILMIPQYPSNEPKNLNPMGYQVVAYFMWGRKGPLPYPQKHYLIVLVHCF